MRAGWGLLLGLLVVGRVVWWWADDAALWTDGNTLRLGIVVPEGIYQTYKEVVIRYQNRTVRCGLGIKGCESLLGRIFERASVLGEVRVTDEGVGELIVQEVILDGGGVGLVAHTRRGVKSFRDQILNVYKVSLSEPYAGLLSGIILGKQERMDEDFYDLLARTGVMHVVAASGFNVVVVGMAALQLFLLFLTRQRATAAAIGAIVVYVLLAGAGPAVVRAGIMGSLVFLAQVLGREYVAAWGLWLAGALMLLFQPWLIRDVSFLLSVSATAGLIFVAPVLLKGLEGFVRRIEKKEGRNSVRGTEAWRVVVGQRLGHSVLTTLATTMAATLTTMPVILIYFESLSIVSVVVNTLVLELVPPLMLVGGMGAFMGLLMPAVAQVVLWVAWPLLALFVSIVDFFGSWELAMVEVPGLGWMFGLGWWVLVVGWLLLKRRRDEGLKEQSEVSVAAKET